MYSYIALTLLLLLLLLSIYIQLEFPGQVPWRCKLVQLRTYFNGELFQQRWCTCLTAQQKQMYHILKVPRSNLSIQTRQPLFWFPSFPPRKYWGSDTSHYFMTAVFHILPKLFINSLWTNDYCPLLWHRVVWQMCTIVFEKPLTAIIISGDESATQGKRFSNIRQTHNMRTILSVPSIFPTTYSWLVMQSFFFHHDMEAGGSSETSIHMTTQCNIPDDRDLHSFQYGNVNLAS